MLTKSEWSYNNRLTISFSDNLTASTTYSILLSEIPDFKGVTIKSFSPYEFTTFFHQGSGTQSDPFTIYTPIQLDCLHYYPQAKFCYKQMEDLDLSGYDNWLPIGRQTSNLDFQGIYDGNNKKISNVVINRPNETYIGLFGYVSNVNSGFSNLTLENFEVTGHSYVGCLGGRITGNISNVSILQSITSGTTYIGGFSGYVSGNCSDIDVSYLTVSGTQYVGGLSGKIYRKTHSNLTCDHIVVEGNNYIGGICGDFDGGDQTTLDTCSITNSSIIGIGNVGYIGGAFGRARDITVNGVNCNNNSIRGINTVGGCLGNGDQWCHLINVNCASCTVEGNNFIGGCIGNAKHDCSIKDSLVENIIVTSNNYYAGGYLGVASNGVELTNLTCASATISGSAYVGGCVGYAALGCSFDNIHCNQINVACNNSNIGGVIGYSTSCNFNNCECTNSKVKGKYNGGGFIGWAKGGSFYDIICDNVTVNEGSYLGGFAGICYDSTTKENCCVINSNIGNDSTYGCGGFAGYLAVRPNYVTEYNDITKNCFVRNTIVKGARECGGFAGKCSPIADDSNIISNCFVYETTINCDLLYSISYCGGFIGNHTSKSLVQNCGVENTTISANGKFVGGFAGFGNMTAEKCYVKDSSVNAQTESIAGFVGSSINGNISKSFVKNTSIEGDELSIGGFAGDISSTTAAIDSCYVTGCSISSSNALTNDNYSLSGFVATNTGTITNCYVHNSTVTGKDDYGALVGIDGKNGETTNVSNCFVSENHDTLIGQAGANSNVTNCYYNVTDLDTFNSKTWSDGAWSNYDTSEFPPKLTELPEP